MKMTSFDGCSQVGHNNRCWDECQYWNYREHRLNYWNIPDYPNILHLTNESVTQNLGETIRQVSNFLGVNVSDENLNKLAEHLQFEKN